MHCHGILWQSFFPLGDQRGDQDTEVTRARRTLSISVTFSLILTHSLTTISSRLKPEPVLTRVGHHWTLHQVSQL